MTVDLSDSIAPHCRLENLRGAKTTPSLRSGHAFISDTLYGSDKAVESIMSFVAIV